MIDTLRELSGILIGAGVTITVVTVLGALRGAPRAPVPVRANPRRSPR